MPSLCQAKSATPPVIPSIDSVGSIYVRDLPLTICNRPNTIVVSNFLEPFAWSLIMDPLSVAASAVTVAMLAGRICTAFADLRSLCRSLPGRLHALNNEVTDLEIILIELASLVERRAVLLNSQQSAIPHLLKNANIKLVELHNIVDRLRTICQDTKIPIIAVSIFRKEQGRLQMLQEDIRSVRCNLNILLGASNSYVFYLLIPGAGEAVTQVTDIDLGMT